MVQRLIDSGYVATIRQISEIKKHMYHYSDSLLLLEKRNRFKAKSLSEKIIYNKVNVYGVNKKTESFVTKTITKNRKEFTIKQLKRQYFRMMSDEKIKSSYPTSKLDTTSGKYTLTLKTKKLIIIYVLILLTQKILKNILILII
jgi:NTE family protein